MTPPEYDISVRELAEFVHRRSDLGGESTFRRSNRALEGIKGHKRIQQSRGSDYRPEIPVERSFVKGEVSLRVVGRVDGIVDGLTPLVEEIKTVEPGWSREADPVYWAQLRIYAGNRHLPLRSRRGCSLESSVDAALGKTTSRDRGSKRLITLTCWSTARGPTRYPN